jgi:ribosome-associated protein
MIYITPSLSLDEKELTYEFIRASGPGGQNVNKVATAVQLRFDVASSSALPLAAKARLKTLAGARMTGEGVLVIEAKRYRSQEQNRLDAQRRLVNLIHKSLVPPKKRTATRPSVASRARRLEAKKQRGEVKRMRQSIPPEGE